MSGAAGGSRINKENLKDTIRDYRDNILKPLNLDKSYSITGVRSRPEKNIFGDIDIVVSFQGGDKKELKQELAQFLSQVDKIPAIPHKKNNKYFIHGNIVSTLYPISGKEGEYVQIDNIVTTSKEEGKFVFNMLDLPAQEQTLAIGLAKTVFTELDEKQIENLFKELNVPIDDRPGEGEEYDFNLNPSELSLRIVPIGKNDGREIWKSNKFEDVKKLTSALGINIEKDKFDNIISKIKKFKNRRSIDRLKGMFAKNIRVGDAEKEIEKGIKKQQALDTVSALEGKYNPLVMSLIKPFIEGETIIVEEEKSQTIALMPGAFKPPHKDHLRRINAAAENSDKAIILISPLDRVKEGEMPISAQQSLAIWKLYQEKNVLSPNVEFLISQDSAPVKTAYDIAIANPQNQYIGVYGKDDIARWKNLPNEKYPNLKASDFGIAADLSASDLRKALVNNEDITPWIPDRITPNEYKQTLGLDNIDEGGEITSFLDERISFKDLEDIDQVADEELETDVVFNKGSDDHFIRRANERGADKKDLIDFFRELGKSKDEFKDEFEELINNYKPGNSKPAIVAKDEYTGFSIPFVSDNIRKILATTVLSPGMKPKEKKTFSFSEQVQGDSIICNNCGWTWKIKDGGNDLYICHKCGHDNTPQQSSSNNFFEPLQNQDLDLNTSSDLSRVDYYKDHIKNVVPSDFKVDKHKDKIVVSNITKKGLEHNKEFKDNLISLTMFMIDNDLNIEPLPSINFIEDDKENANNMLGRTAHYDPNKQCVTLYTYGRHPKDILRSYAHEMIHHKQNLEDRLQHYDGTNINEDDHLKQLEIEAYRDGNIYFRSWENSTKK
jgi:hypothetical protein